MRRPWCHLAAPAVFLGILVVSFGLTATQAETAAETSRILLERQQSKAYWEAREAIRAIKNSGDPMLGDTSRCLQSSECAEEQGLRTEMFSTEPADQRENLTIASGSISE